MSLHGTLETFALPDVLALLAATKKSGELRVVGGSTDGRVWFDAGAVVGSEVGRSVTFVDAVFELLRLDSGKFSFDAEKAAPAPAAPSAIEPLLAEAQARLAEWKSIEAVIPSLDHAVKLVSEVPDPHVMVTGEQWRALVGVASAPSVTGVVERLGIGEFDTCRTLKGLVEAGLLTVEQPSAPAPAPAPAPLPEPEAATPEPAPEAVPAPAPAPEVAADAPAAEQPAPAPTAKAAVPAQLGSTPTSQDKPTVKALTNTVAASAPAADEAAPEAAPETPAPAAPAAPTPAAAGEADELVRQVAALDTVPEPVAEEAPEAPPAPAAEAPTTEGEEPINRGLLLKFLSSVRT